MSGPIDKQVYLVGQGCLRRGSISRELCWEVVMGLLEQAKLAGRLLNNGRDFSRLSGAFENLEPKYFAELQQLWDDITGKELDSSKVVCARAEEMDTCRQHGVYVKVPLSVCYRATGKKPIGVRWVDIRLMK